jgi:cytidyltransferase-like protein
MRILIFGLPGSGKTFLAERLTELLGDKVEWFNADKVRANADDWDFSDEGRLRQNRRMQSLCEGAEANGKIAIADFVAPFDTARQDFSADYNIFVDTIDAGRFPDTNRVFQRPDSADYVVIQHRGDIDAKLIAYEIGDRFIWNNQAATTQMLGRFQPWHAGHQALFERALAKHDQVYLMVRDMSTDAQNPFSAEQVVHNLKTQLTNFVGRVKISIVPNILNITYGRDVGYKIEQEVFDDEIHSISATKIREQMRTDGKL